jgi:hypothetical protein
MTKIVLLLFACCLFSCKKNTESIKTSSSINVINAAVDIAAIKINPGVSDFSYVKTTDVVNFGASKFYFAELGQHYIIAVSNLDTTKVLFNGSYDMQPGFYTMYLAGQAPNIDTMFKKETGMPFIKTDVSTPDPADYVTNVRFVNLSPNSPALKINIKNSSSNEVENFGYKSIGSWKGYGNSATGTTNYIFEVRNAETNAILLTYTFGATTTNRFKNVALVIKGLVGGTGTNAFGIFSANYF